MGCSEATDSASRCTLPLVEANADALAEAWRYKRCWEVLSYRVDQEAKDGATCIQAALKDPANATICSHEMHTIPEKSRARPEMN